MISDFVKGRKKYDYPATIQKGIALHRAIDQYTDTHEATATVKNIFRPHYRLYSGAFADVIYDHYLANDKEEFPGNKLFDFSAGVYDSLAKYSEWFPPNFSLFFPYMKTQNWLYHYRTMDGTAKSLHGVVRRAKYLTESQTAYKLFEKHYQLLGDCYRQFWAGVKAYASHEMQRLLIE